MKMKLLGGGENTTAGQCDSREFHDSCDDSIHGRACGSVAVQRDEGVHFEFGRAERSLDHNWSDGFEDCGEELAWVERFSLGFLTSQRRF